MKANSAKPTIADELANLAMQVNRLIPDHRYPDRFHENKSEIAGRLRTLSRVVNGRAA